MTDSFIFTIIRFIECDHAKRMSIEIARNLKRKKDGNDRRWKRDIVDIENVMMANTRAIGKMMVGGNIIL